MGTITLNGPAPVGGVTATLMLQAVDFPLPAVAFADIHINDGTTRETKEFSIPYLGHVVAAGATLEVLAQIAGTPPAVATFVYN